jgi:hypothetical protein
MPRYEVHTQDLGNCWTDSGEDGEDEVPTTFATYEEAEAYLQEYLEDIREANASGEFDSTYDRYDFQIVEVPD